MDHGAADEWKPEAPRIRRFGVDYSTKWVHKRNHLKKIYNSKAWEKLRGFESAAS